MKLMRKQWLGLALGLVLVAGIAVTIAWAAEKDEDELTLDQVPAAVKATIERESQGGKIKEIEKEDEDGKPVYEVEIVKGGNEVELTIAEDGKVIELETEIALKDAPAAVRATLEKEAQGGKITEVEKEIENGKTLYSADILVGQKKTEVEVAEDGKVLKREAEDEDEDEDEGEEVKVTLDQVPAPVKATLERESKGGKIGEIEKETEHGQTVYSAEMVVDGKKMDVEVDANGKVLEQETDDADNDEDDD